MLLSRVEKYRNPLVVSEGEISFSYDQIITIIFKLLIFVVHDRRQEIGRNSHANFLSTIMNNENLTNHCGD